jgi:hypothetical protein
MTRQEVAKLLRESEGTVGRLVSVRHLQPRGGDFAIAEVRECREKRPSAARGVFPTAPQAEWDAAATAERGEWSEVLFKGWDMGDDASEKQMWHAWRLAGNFM